jgi:hypothetical protein
MFYIHKLALFDFTFIERVFLVRLNYKLIISNKINSIDYDYSKLIINLAIN